MSKKERFGQKRCNYKLYKAKKQWITACATVIFALGAGAVISTNVSANDSSNSTDLGVEGIVNSAGQNVSNNSLALLTSDVSGDSVEEVPNQDTATVELTGNEIAQYNGKAFGNTYEDEVQFDGSNLILKINDEEQDVDTDFMNNDANFTFTDQSGKVISTPINAGSYKVSLSQSGLDSLRQLFPSIILPENPNDIQSKAKFVINQGTPDITLSGHDKIVYNGKPVSLTDINNGGTIGVQITFPNLYDENGQPLDINYKLQDGDYIWPEEDDPSQAPKDVKHGSNQYQLALNRTQETVDHLNQAILSKYPQLKGNYVLTTHMLGDIQNMGKNWLEITPAPAKLTQSGLAGKIYDGTPGNVSLDQMIDGLKANLLNGDQLNTSDFPPISDSNEIVDWYGYNDQSKEFEKLPSAPTAAGTYHVKLNENFLFTLSSENPNYYFTKEPTNTDEGPTYIEEIGEPEFNYDGYFTYIISPVEVASAKLSGDGHRNYNGQPVSDTDIANSGIKVDVVVPSRPDQTLVLSASDFNWNSGNSVPSKVGNYNLTLNENGINKIKSHYSNLPFVKWVDENNHSTITGTAQFSIVAPTEKVTDTKSVTETIHYQDTEGNQLANDVVKTITFNRSGVKNTVTNEVTWNTWAPVGKMFPTVVSPTIKGYTPSMAEIPAYEITADSNNREVIVIYTKNSDPTESVSDAKTVTETIHYQDTEGNQLANDVVKSVIFNRNGVKNLVTNEVAWGAWTPAGSQMIAAVVSPMVKGYTPSMAEVPTYEVIPDSDDKVVTVIYTKNSTDEPTTPTKPAEPIQPTNPETPSQPENSTNSVEPVKNINNDDHLTNSEPISNEEAVVKDQQNKKLPQTGNNEVITLGGLLLAGLATSFGFGGLKKKID